MGAGTGIGIGIGQGLGEIAEGFRNRHQRQAEHRDQQANDIEGQIRGVRDNLSKVDPNSKEAEPLKDQLQQLVLQHNALFKPHETPALFQRIQGFFGRHPGQDTSGLVTPGNIDTSQLPAVANPDGGMSTVFSTSFGTDQGEVLIPRVVGGKVVSPDEAFAEYQRTGKHLGIFDSPKSATAYAHKLHNSEAERIKSGANMTVAGQLAQVPLPPVQQTDVLAKVRDLTAAMKANGSSPKEIGDAITQYLQNNYKTVAPTVDPEEWNPTGTPFLKDGKVYQSEVNKAGVFRTVETGADPGSLPEKKPLKPLEPKTNAITGGLESITDPNTGAVYTASTFSKGPPEVQQMATDISTQVAAQQKVKEEAEDKRQQAIADRQDKTLQAALDRQEVGFQNALKTKDYADAKKVVITADTNYQAAIDRAVTMDKNVEAARGGDQQAMLSLVANHIGMTLGGVQGAKVSRALWDEAVGSVPWLDKMEAKWSPDGYLSGVTLTPDQMKQMVQLAHQKVDILHEHKIRVEDEYHDELNAGASGKPASGTAKPKVIVVRPEDMK